MRELRNRKVKFPLKMRDDARVRRIEELRNYTEPEDQKLILSYYEQGRLVTWLRDRYYDGLADQVSRLSPNDSKFAQKLFRILDMECKVSKKLDLSAIQAGNQKRARVQGITDDKEIIAHYEAVAFDDREFSFLLSAISNVEYKTIYLCGDKFKFPPVLNQICGKIRIVGIVTRQLRSKPLLDLGDYNFNDLKGCNVKTEHLDLTSKRYERVKQITDDEIIHRNYEKVAFNDTELKKMIFNRGIDRIYLYGEEFTPVYYNDRKIHLIGINKPQIRFPEHNRALFEKAGFVFENVIFELGSQLAEKEVGDVFEFGKFENKPIKWMVLKKDQNRIMVITQGLLCKKPFHTHTNANNSWKDSGIRSWLNHDFFYAAFSKSEKDCIVLSKIETETPHPNDYPASQKDIPKTETNDRIFLLDREEEEQMSTGVPPKLNDIRIWLRTPHPGTKKVYALREAHRFTGIEATERHWIRPAMYLWID